MNKEVGNVCLEQCTGACCRNLVLNDISESELNTLTPVGTRVSRISPMTDLYDAISQVSGQGVIVQPLLSRASPQFDVYLSGNCPNLDEGKCTVYETRPQTCRKLDAASTKCNQIRNMQGLSTIMEPTVIPLMNMKRKK
jgi:Fe-S-cluster containining protein